MSGNDNRRDRITSGYAPDTYHDPLGNVLIELGVEDGLLQPGERSICVHQTALHEHVAVALEFVAGRACWQRDLLLVEEASQAL